MQTSEPREVNLTEQKLQLSLPELYFLKKKLMLTLAGTADVLVYAGFSSDWL